MVSHIRLNLADDGGKIQPLDSHFLPNLILFYSSNAGKSVILSVIPVDSSLSLRWLQSKTDIS